MKFFKKINRKQNSRNGKRVENNFKEIDKGFFKGRKIECFNCGGLGHLSSDYPSPKDIKKSMQATQNGMKDKSDSMAFQGLQNDYLPFIAYVDSKHDLDSDYEFNDDKNAYFLENMVNEYQHLIQSHIKVNTTYESPKSDIGLPNEEKMNYIENF